jgi:tellurite resistance protein TerC
MTQVKRVARIVAGFALLLAGAAMMVLPGPGIVTIALGLALLARDFQWAHNALERLKETGHNGAEWLRDWWRRFRTGSSATDDAGRP